MCNFPIDTHFVAANSLNVIDSAVDWSPRFAGKTEDSDLVLVVTKKRRLWLSRDDGAIFSPVT